MSRDKYPISAFIHKIVSKHKTLTCIALDALAIYIIVIVILYLYDETLFATDFNMVMLSAGTGGLIGALASFVRMLIRRTSTQNPDNSTSSASMERSLSSKLQTVREELENTKSRINSLERASTKVTDETVGPIVDRLVNDRMNSELDGEAAEKIGKMLNEKAQKRVDYARVRKLIEDIFNNSETRVSDHSRSAEKSAILFKWIGIILAISGLGAAAFAFVEHYGTFGSMAPASPPQAADGSSNGIFETFGHLPFIMPLTVLAEVLALIMFRYHSKSLEMMRYFSNEVSTLSLRKAAALTILERGSQKTIVELANEMLRAERNIIMRKDERTLEMNQNRDEDALLRKLTDKWAAFQKDQNREERQGREQ